MLLSGDYFCSEEKDCKQKNSNVFENHVFGYGVKRLSLKIRVPGYRQRRDGVLLRRPLELLEQEVDDAVDGLSSLLEPIIMSILGILIGGLVVAMYLPIFKMGAAI